MAITWNPYTTYGTLNKLNQAIQQAPIPDYKPVFGWDTPEDTSGMYDWQKQQEELKAASQNLAETSSLLDVTAPTDGYTGTIGGDWKSMNKGQQANAAFSAGLGALSLGMDIASVGGQRLNLGKAPAVSYQEGTMPTYQTGDFMNRAYRARPQGASFGQVAGTTIKGAQIGAQLGGGVGAAIGAGVGAVGGLVAGGVAKRRQRREKEKALQQARMQQQDFNTRALDFSQQQTAQNEYRRRNDPYERMSNFYTA